jgi:hypothetical protein
MKFDEAAARWVQQHFRGIDPNPLIGTVQFEIDWFACDTGPNYCKFVVSWKEEHDWPGPMYRTRGGISYHSMRRKIVEYRKDIGSDYDVTSLIRDITELALSDEPRTNSPDVSYRPAEGQIKPD